MNKASLDRPQTPRYKLIVKDKRSSAFYDWLALTDGITFADIVG